jgi:excisionase family DNA binding protein
MEQQEIIGAAEAAQTLGVSVDRIYALIKARRLPARKISRDWVIVRADLALVAERRPGRPRRPETMESHS